MEFDLPSTARKRIRNSWFAMIFEDAVRAFWPAWTAVFFAVALWLFSAESKWAQFVHPYMLGAICLLFVIGCAFRFRLPDMSKAEDCLDRSLPQRPLTAIRDRQAIGCADAGSVALWEAHRQDMVTLAASLETYRPDLRLAVQDPFALRYVAMAMLVLAVLFAPERSLQVAPRAAASAIVAIESGFDAWLVAPSYTNRPVLYLDADIAASEIITPVGSIVELRLYGDSDGFAVETDISDRAELAAGGQREYVISKSGSLTLTDPSGQKVAWKFQAIADQPPDMPKIGNMLIRDSGGVTIPIGFTDDYGVEQAGITFELALDRIEHTAGLAIEPEDVEPSLHSVRLPFATVRTDFEVSHFEDFSDHRWGGLPVRMLVSAIDASNLTTIAEQPVMMMPGRVFSDPLAEVLAEQRRDLLWNRNNAERIIRVLDAVAARPDDQFETAGDYLVFRMATRRLRRLGLEGIDDSELAEAEQILWRAALRIEEGNLAALRAALRDAAEQLTDALLRNDSDEEIARLLDAYREALQRFVREMASDSGGETLEASTGSGEAIDEDRIMAMLNEIESLLRDGRQYDAEQAMRALQELMSSLVGGMPGGGSGGSEIARQLQETLRQQQGLADRAFQMLQRERSAAGRSPVSGADEIGGTGQPGEMLASDQLGSGLNGAALGRAQEELMQSLLSQMNSRGDNAAIFSNDVRAAAQQAAQAMERARDRLSTREFAEAFDEQNMAMRSLSEAIREIWEEMSANGQGAGGPPGMVPGTDPLGRTRSGLNRSFSRDWILPDQQTDDRVLELRREIRQRAGDRTRPQLERDYLRRLLRPY